MFYEDFTKLHNDEIDTIISHVIKHYPEIELDVENTTIQSADIPFYHGYQMLEIYNHTIHPVKKYYVIYNEIDGQSDLIDYTNQLIYKLNKDIPIILDHENVLEYVKFFFAYVSGSQGQFKVVSSISDIPWRDAPPPNAHEVISQMIAPISVIDYQKNGTYKLEAFMTFKTGLLKADIDVDQFGNVTMSEEEMLIDDMPLIDDIMVN